MAESDGLAKFVGGQFTQGLRRNGKQSGARTYGVTD
jgi:hypothetical protein